MVDGLDTLVACCATEIKLSGHRVLAERVETGKCSATTAHAVNSSDGDVVSTDTHIGVTGAELTIVEALPRVGFVVTALVRTKRAVYIGGEGGGLVVDELEGVALTVAIGDGEVGGALEDEVEGGLDRLVFLAKLKGIEADISQDGDVMPLLEVVLLLGGAQDGGAGDRGVIGGVVGGGAAETTDSATTTGSHDRGNEEGEQELNRGHSGAVAVDAGIRGGLLTFYTKCLCASPEEVKFIEGSHCFLLWTKYLTVQKCYAEGLNRGP